MSPDALQSFITVVSSLRQMTEGIQNIENFTFKIVEGSARICVQSANNRAVDFLYDEIGLAISGESENVEITAGLRAIQKELKKSNYEYNFKFYNNGSEGQEIHNRLIHASRISLKRRTRPYTYKLKVLRGYLNQIGGVNPNYHFDFGDGGKMTIDCSLEQAQNINQHLYKNVNAIVLCKEWNNEERRNELFHKTIVSDSESYFISDFFREYYSSEELVDRLSVVYDFVDKLFEVEPKCDAFNILKSMLRAFNDDKLHLSELKTWLVVSKPFNLNSIIREVRTSLLNTYEIKRVED